MFRSKSFNINNRSVGFGSLTRSKSCSDMYTTLVNMKTFITIKEVSPEEALYATEKMLTETMADDWFYFDFLKLDEEQERWKMRYNQAYNILNCISTNAKLQSMRDKTGGSKKFFFVAYFRSIPVGALQLLVKDNHENELPEVSFLATHCGIRGCGILLIESAVNKSQQSGMEGKLQLSPYERARSAYMAMGFTRVGGHLELYPADRSDKWKWNEIINRYECY
ncbi:GNAT family N-acetyltransferase [Xenorhabdus cabanillasii]|uniref:GNAT family N-acetyltransferase n=2 Tax=Xenorhabdus cabanillasii TaxID=351673 RepID=UPI000C039AE4|nr:GNAT family N-acetyltransferase [Xenorhabdus cabanillasii]PHM77337.1 N-acetyltransferase [Xenorhabdus cabanillasii JM26]